MFKSHIIKSNCIVPRKNDLASYGVPVFAPDYSATVLLASIYTMSILVCILPYFIEYCAQTSIVHTLILQ
jgi:hypothetical protein